MCIMMTEIKTIEGGQKRRPPFGKKGVEKIWYFTEIMQSTKHERDWLFSTAKKGPSPNSRCNHQNVNFGDFLCSGST